MFSAELPLVFIFVQKSTFPENFRKFTKIIFPRKTPGARRRAGGGPTVTQGGARRAPLGRIWLAPGRLGPPLRLPFGILVTSSPKKRTPEGFSQIRSAAPPTLETLVRETEVPVLAPYRGGDWREIIAIIITNTSPSTIHDPPFDV